MLATARIIRGHQITLREDNVRSVQPEQWGEYVRIWHCLKCGTMFEGPRTFEAPTPVDLKACEKD